jgi:thiol-disulfide isomerase/thioredoxin
MVLIIQAIVLSSCVRPPSESESTIQIGSSAPKFTLRDLSGQMVSLDQYRGKVVMLDFWATWCGPCRISMPKFEELQKEYPSALVLLAINVQEPAQTVRDYVKEQSIGSRVLLDEEGSVAQAYGTIGIPMEVLIDKQGIVRHIQSGFNQALIAHLRAQIEALK